MAMMLEPASAPTAPVEEALRRVAAYPRLRFMGSKYRVMPQLLQVFGELQFERALDAFSGSGVVGYGLKAMGKQVAANDFLAFTATVARATIENPSVTLTPGDLAAITGPAADNRDFIQRTFEGIYFPPEDLAFLDSAWSNIEGLPVYKRDLAIAALCLAAARKQPRGVFTVTDFRYNDGRRSMRMPLRDLFPEAAQSYNAVVFDNSRPNIVTSHSVFELDPDDFDLAYFDPPYAPPRDDNDYIKRYHFLEGLAVYWRGLEIMAGTKMRKIPKRFTPFAYRHTIEPALRDLFHRFRRCTIVLSYASNATPDEQTIFRLLSEVKDDVKVYSVPHRYSFGTHSTALRREVHEYIFVAR
jgi:adenine-specific DNA-methyltransferase